MASGDEARTPRLSFDVRQPQRAAPAPRQSRLSLLEFEPGMAQLHRKLTSSSFAQESADAPLPVGRTSTLSTGMNLITVMVGAGVLSFPKVFASAGWYAGPLILVACAVSGREAGVAADKALAICEERIRAGESFSFRRPEKVEDMVEVAFGKAGKEAVGAVLSVFMLLLCGAFMILIGASLQFLSNAMLPYRAWVLMTTVLFAGLCLLQDMDFLSRLSSVGVAASFVYVLAIAQAGLQAGFTNRSSPDFAVRYFPEKAFDVGIVLSVMFLSFGYSIVLPTVRAEMAAPEELPKAIDGSIVIVTFIYGTVSVMAYWGWGNAVNDNVLGSMIDGQGNRMIAGVALSLAVIANLFVTFPIILNVVAISTESRLGVQYSPAARLGLLAIAVTMGLLCPFFLEVLTLIGATVGMVMLTFVPIVVYWKLVITSGGAGPPRSEYIKHGGVVFLGLTAMTFGTYEAVGQLLEAMQKPGGNPFTSFWDPM